MSSNSRKLSCGELDTTIDEILPLSEQMSRLGQLSYRKLFTEVTKSSKDLSTKVFDHEEQNIKSLYFENHHSIKSLTAKSESTDAKSCVFVEGNEEKPMKQRNSDPVLTKPSGQRKSILKSQSKSKYLKWHKYLQERHSEGVKRNISLEKEFIAPYFVKGSEEKPTNWDDKRWKQEQEWWDDNQWEAEAYGAVDYDEEDDEDESGIY